MAKQPKAKASKAKAPTPAERLTVVEQLLAEMARRQGHVAKALLNLEGLVRNLPPMPGEVSVERQGFLAGLDNLKREIADG